LNWLLVEFRLIVNKSIRIALRENLASRARLSKVAYASLSSDHAIHKAYINSAFELALGALKAHRKRVRAGKPSTSPYVRRLVLKMAKDCYRLDRETGRLRIPIRGTVGVQFVLPISAWHRSFFNDSAWSLGSLTLVPGKVLIVVRKEVPKAYDPIAAIALDTNEDTLDGVAAMPWTTRLVTLSLGGVRQIQATYSRRRRWLARKKAHDKRVQRRLLAREGLRERNRVLQRLNLLTKGLVQTAASTKSAVVLETLTLHGTRGHSRRMNRRLSSWPRGELHRQVEYKAALAGVPVIKVNPAWTSKTCPVCGARRRDRVGQDFVCEMCDWEMDRQHNAGLNILKSALASNEALARAVRLRPGALRHDVVSPLYDLSALRAGAREEPSGAEFSPERREHNQYVQNVADLQKGTRRMDSRRVRDRNPFPR